MRDQVYVGAAKRREFAPPQAAEHSKQQQSPIARRRR
jgi:hypothetical protein